jgi:hypothetical protein
VELIQLAGAAVPQPEPECVEPQHAGHVRRPGDRGAGSPSFGIAYTLDGANHNMAYDNLNLPLPFPDAMQEFRVETSAQNAQNGFHSGARSTWPPSQGRTCITRDVFEFYRNHRFNATNPFNAVDPATGTRRDDGLKRNQFGGTLGGPIKTDKAFFFGAYQGTRTSDRQSDRLTFVPTTAMLAGDFSTVASAACRTQGNSPYLRRSALSATASTHPCSARRRSRLPSVSLPPAMPADARRSPRRVTSTRSRRSGRSTTTSTRITRCSGRYVGTTYFYEPPFGKTDGNVLSTILGGRDNLAQTLAIGDTRVLSNATVNNIRFSFNRTAVHRTGQDFFGVKDVGINTYDYTPSYMLLGVTNAFSLGGGTESEARFKTNTTSISDDLTMIRGPHQWGFGTMVSFWNSPVEGERSIARAVHNRRLGDPASRWRTSSLVAWPGPTASFNPRRNTLSMQQWYFGVYAQDVWKLSPTMTLNYGLRWEPWFPQQQRNGAIYNFDIQKYLTGVRSTEFPNAPRDSPILATPAS